jgi:hypothetical protein
MRIRQRLEAGHFTNQFAGHARVWALIWKDWVQVSRRFDARSVISWLLLFGSGLGMLIASDWGTRIWVFVVWGLFIGQVCSKRFNSDINLWVLFRLLPFSVKEILLAEIASSVVWATLLCWFAYGICSLVGFHPSLIVAVLSPGIILCITLASVFDILRQSKVDALIAGHAAEMGAVGLLFGLIMAGIPLVLIMWISSWMSADIILWMGSLLGLFLSLGIAYGMWLLDEYQYKKIT